MKRLLTFSIHVVLLLALLGTWVGVSFSAEAASSGDTGPADQKTWGQGTLPLATASPG